MNYWGYEPGNYFAVKASYAADPLHASWEFRMLIRRLHEKRHGMCDGDVFSGESES